MTILVVKLVARKVFFSEKDFKSEVLHYCLHYASIVVIIGKKNVWHYYTTFLQMFVFLRELRSLIPRPNPFFTYRKKRGESGILLG